MDDIVFKIVLYIIGVYAFFGFMKAGEHITKSDWVIFFLLPIYYPLAIVMSIVWFFIRPFVALVEIVSCLTKRAPDRGKAASNDDVSK